MSYRNAARRRHTKGVVLFTVVCILLFLFIMIMSTLSVVSSAQTRTYTKFKENQAYFTARSGLESVTTSLWNRTYNGTGDRTDPSSYDAANNKLYKAFLRMMYPIDYDTNNPKRGSAFIESNTNLTFDQMDTNANIAKIKVKFPQPESSVYNGADLKYVYGECTVYIQKTDLKKARFISHATLGDTESTIVLYVGPENETPDVFENALTTFGGSGADNMQVYGGASLNINQPPTNTVKYTNAGTTIQGNQYFNCNMELDNAKLYPGANGTVIAGNLEFKNSGAILANGSDAKVFVGGKISSNTGPTIGESGKKVTLYCDSFAMGNDNFKLYGDLYIYGDDDVELNGTVYGSVYHMGTGNINISNKATITEKLYTKGTSVTHNNGLTIGSTSYGSDQKTIPAENLVAPPSDAETKEQALATMPKLDDVQATYAPYDGSTGTFNAWGYKKIGEGDEKNATNYTPFLNDAKSIAKYKDEEGWVEWPGFSSLPYDATTDYYYIDATTNSVNYHVSSSYSEFIPNDKKLLIKGTNTVNFYFDEGNYAFGNRANITNESILNSSNIILTTEGANNITLKTNMYFWGNSTLTLNNDCLINAYMLAPQGTLTVNTANSSLPNISGITYDALSVNNSTVLGMGSLVFNVVNCSNMPKFFFVRKPSTAPDPSEPGKFWKDLYYFNR